MPNEMTKMVRRLMDINELRIHTASWSEIPTSQEDWRCGGYSSGG
jgi:hypothetical protein